MSTDPKEAAPDYSELGARGYRSVLEIRVTKVGFAAGNHPGADPEIALRLVAEARLIDVKTGRPLWLHGLGYMSPPHKTSIWGRDSAALVRQELDYASNVLAERIVESALLGSDFSLLATGLVCGLEPSHPGPSRLDVDVSAVESLTPRLEWKPPPPPGQPADWERAQDIRYDLRIWHVATNSPPELIYERMGLTEPKHQLEQPLAPQTEYFWSVRARFTLDGQARTTRWNAGTANATLSTAIAEDVF
ncbi:hypothetical protein LMG23994_05954 [Cupriavidus pinatubonensis]|uniref:Fibronectin type-III domain-containing protein n=1 Tax=Cupriavidus pinatubonensis TaxID=248026 RepID=A0ABM8XZW7_9BURK|nr:hypothetical protein LMG23994_05954 [Cupriavidus pinatubonensis]